MAETNIEPDKPFLFLKLPTEIRVMIYGLLFAEHHVTQRDGLLTRATYKAKCNILVLNKQLYNEAAPILDKTHVFLALTWLPRSSSRGNMPRKTPGCITFCKGNCVLPPRLHADRITRLRLSVGAHPLHHVLHGHGVIGQNPKRENILLYTLKHVSKHYTNLKILHFDATLPRLWLRNWGGKFFRESHELRRGDPPVPEMHLRWRTLRVMWQLIDRLEWLYLLMNARLEDGFETWRDSLAFPEMWTRTMLKESGNYDEGGEPMDLRYELDCQQENVDVGRFATFPGSG